MACLWNGETLSLATLLPLAQIPQLYYSLLEQGSNESYLDTLTSLVLDPKYTASIFATHEPLFVEFCNRLLLRSSRQHDHFDAVIALARVLPIAPQLSVYVEELVYRRCSGVFIISHSQDSASLTGLEEGTLTAFLITLLRLLDFDNDVFSPLVSPAQLQMLLTHPLQHIRWLSVRILCASLHASDAATHEMMRKFTTAEAMLADWDGSTIDYGFQSLWEVSRINGYQELLQIAREARASSRLLKTTHRTISQSDLCSNTTCLANVLLPSIYRPLQISSLVMTPTTQENLGSLASAINQSRHVLISGLAGCGKTSLIRALAACLNKLDSMITLHLNEQTDAKLLVGLYTTGSNPGSFIWKPGVLTTAVQEGRWILIEDLDKAPPDVISIILPLLDGNKLIVPGFGALVRASREFRIMATVRSTLNLRSEEVDGASSILGLRKWKRISLTMLSPDDLAQIIIFRFPILQSYLPGIMRMYDALHALHFRRSAAARVSQSRQCGPQDLLRYCSRVQNLLQCAGVVATNDPIDESIIDQVFMEAVDVFSGFAPLQQTRLEIASLIAQELHIPYQRMQYCLETRVPDYSTHREVVKIGRASLPRNPRPPGLKKLGNTRQPFALTNHALRYMEALAISVRQREPLLLVGETGTGKTAIIQNLAESVGVDLVVVNLSQQSEAGDLLGGYKPISTRSLLIPMSEEFSELFDATFTAGKNQAYLKSIRRATLNCEWKRLLALWEEALRMVGAIYSDTKPEARENSATKKRRRTQGPRHQILKAKWEEFASQVRVFERHASIGQQSFAFSFVEGNIVKAVRNGDWVLLDEINLATPETLESIADLLSDVTDSVPSLLLSETGNADRIRAHPNFRIFAAMNPATDIGKRDLPSSLRSRFAEYHIRSPDQDTASLLQIIELYLVDYVRMDVRAVANVAKLYVEVKTLESDDRLVDGADQKPHFSLRTLTRTLTYVTDVAASFGLRRALFEGFSMSYLTLLNKESASLVIPLIKEHILGSQRNHRAMMNQPCRCPGDETQFVQLRHYWMRRGTLSIEDQAHYILTPSVEANLLNLVRATTTRRYPVLLQGPTSSGKTSMIEYLANISGNKFVRINNHEHTDLQEYLGNYVSGQDGQLQYQDGVLVRALREGHWIVLDELNLAPSDILEALNRLLDDNRELFIPETQEIVRPQGNFMLFATQNPAGMYGGRKILSRAFRNRFLEIHFDDIPEDELETILRERTQIAPSFCSRVVTIYKKLAILRQAGRLFEQRNSFATLRDLFRWALREADFQSDLAANGFMLLAERVRLPEERLVVKSVIEEVMKVSINVADLYSTIPEIPEKSANDTSLAAGIVWTKSMRRLYVLVTQALKNQEPVLLVGETGCGKTTICQVIAEVQKARLHIVNAHQNTETGDLIGAQRPVRNKSLIEDQVAAKMKNLLQNHLGRTIDCDDFAGLLLYYKSLLPEDLAICPSEALESIEAGLIKTKALFEWSDGSLIHAMKSGHHFLLDEISLADDSVLERLNSVLESGRTILLAEKGSEDSTVVAAPGFQFLATMNPGGDYGKRELSPALRNRFTEIWVPPLCDAEDMLEIAEYKLKLSMKEFARPMVDYALWFGMEVRGTADAVSIRDLLSWVDFANLSSGSDAYSTIFEGVNMVFLDGLGANPASKVSASAGSPKQLRQDCISMLSTIFEHDMSSLLERSLSIHIHNDSLTFGNYRLQRQGLTMMSEFQFAAPTTAINAARLVRALQFSKPILVEGDPGVGKSTLVTALAAAAGVPLTRINLSDQTDIMDLFGSDVPVEGSSLGQFTWRDAPFLRAMQQGEWVLLDEMNLASQSVLEGLNACLDHRGQVYVPELDRTFSRHPTFRLFAAQNPHAQGGGRKGLPASFVNRFNVVYADALGPEDMTIICSGLFPTTPQTTIAAAIKYVSYLNDLIKQNSAFASEGSPWEFNLRDILRWLALIGPGDIGQQRTLSDYQGLLFQRRFRSLKDVETSMTYTGSPSASPWPHDHFHALSTSAYQCGLSILPRSPDSGDRYTPMTPRLTTLPIQESIMICVEQAWPCLLVGPSGSGKTTVLRQLSSLVGATLVELNMNADMDTMDLLGGYEQLNMQRHVQVFFEGLEISACSALRKEILSNTGHGKCLCALIQLAKHSKVSELKVAQELLSELSNTEYAPQFLHFEAECVSLLLMTAHEAKPSFEWIDGTLVRALEAGHWLVLDNANLCNSAVLDRLNSLLEPEGVLLMNEHRSPDGSARSIKPHSSFRLFLTMDPLYGELSRAMRNRCVEIFVPAIAAPNANQIQPFLLDSSMARFRLFSDIDWRSLDRSFLHSVACICFDHLAVCDFISLARFHSQGLDGYLALGDGQKADLFAVSNVFQRLARQDEGISSAIQQLYEDTDTRYLSQQGFIDLQTFHPLNNHFAASIEIHDDGRISMALWLAGLLEMTIMLELFLQKVFSRLERSLASSKGMAILTDSTEPLYGLLFEFGTSLATSIGHQIAFSLGSQLDLDRLWDILFVLREVLETSHTSTFNQDVFRNQLVIGESLVKQVIHRPRLRKIGLELDAHLKRFQASWELKTGLSMEPLWCALKPQSSGSLLQLNYLLRLEDSADYFDRLASRSNVNLESLATLRGSMVSTYGLSNTDELLMQQQIQVLEGSLREVENEADLSESHDDPYFRQCFAGLRQYSALAGSFHPSKSTTLENLACWPTRRSMQANLQTIGSESFGQVLEYRSSDDFALWDALRGSLPAFLLKKLDGLNQVPLRSLGRLHQELPLLSMFTTERTEVISENQYRQLNQRLVALHKQLLECFRSALGSDFVDACGRYIGGVNHNFREPENLPDTSSLDERASKTPAEAQLEDVLKSHLLPSMWHLREASREETNIRSHTAGAWIGFFAGYLLLYLPDKPFDPALKASMEIKRFHRAKDEMIGNLAALRIVEAAFTGGSANLRCTLLERRLQSFGDEPVNPAIVRPEVSEINQLQGEFTNILASILGKCPSIEASPWIGQKLEEKRQEVSLIRQNIAQVKQRLTNSFRVYDDMVQPILCILEGLDLGLWLATSTREEDHDFEDAIRVVCNLTPLLSDDVVDLYALRISDLRTSFPGIVDTKLAYLRLAITERSISGSLDKDALSTVHETFNSFYNQWKTRLELDQNSLAAQSSLYRYQGGDEQTEEVEAAEFSELFPEYGISSKMDASEANNDPASTARALANAHESLFRPKSCSCADLSVLLRSGSESVLSLWDLCHDRAEFPLSNENLMCSVLLALDSTSTHFEAPSKPGNLYNFYEDSNLIEAQGLSDLTRRIRQRFRQVQKVWPEHATLGEVIRICDEVLEMKHSDPLARLLVKCEQLHGYVYEWKTVASREFGVDEIFDRLTNLLISWRRLELSTWARLLDMEDIKCSEDAKSWWFIAYEAVIAASMSTDQGDISVHTEHLTSTLITFLRTTSKGQFSPRLRMLLALRVQVEHLAHGIPAFSIINSALSNVLGLFARFESTVLESIKTSRKALEKNLREIVLLASWKDTNITALRESAKRSHQKLFKVIRKYRTALAASTEAIIDQGLVGKTITRDEKLVDPEVIPIKAADDRALSICQRCIPEWSNRSARFVRPEKTALIMAQLTNFDEHAQESTAYVERISRNLVDSIKAFQKETPLILTEENKPLIKHLKTRKRKLFADTLKDLRAMGFKSNTDLGTLENQATLSKILAHASPLDQSGPDIVRSREFFYESLQNISTIRQNVGEHSEDLNDHEILRSLGYLEGILAVVLRQRSILAKASSDSLNFNAEVETMRNIWRPDYVVHPASEGSWATFNLLRRRFRWLSPILDTIKVVIEKHGKMSGTRNEAALCSLGIYQSRVLATSNAVAALPVLPTGLISTSHQEFIQSARILINQLGHDLELWKASQPELGFALKRILPWTAIPADSGTAFSRQFSNLTSEDVDTNLSNLMDSMLVGVQRVQEKLKLMPDSTHQGWLMTTEESVTQSLQSLQLDGVTSRLQALTASLASAVDGDALQLASALHGVALPIFEQYHASHSSLLHHFFQMHRSLCELLCVISGSFKQIVTNGFCSPREKSTDQGESQKLETGTGLGEGEGAEDISKDIQDDEDLSELAQNAKKEMDDDISDEEDAVDMQHDELEGTMGDSMHDSQDEEEKGDGDDDDDDSDDLEDETGDVDDLDPSAVDEKLWDGSTDENSKEKDAEEANGKEKDEMTEKQSQSQSQKPQGRNEDDESEADGAEEDENVVREENQELNEHTQEEAPLDLPDEMELDGDSASLASSHGDGMSEMSDVDMDGKEEEQNQEEMGQDDISNHGGIDDSDADLDTETAENKLEETNPVESEAEDEGLDDSKTTLPKNSVDANADLDNVDQSEPQGLGQDSEQFEESHPDPMDTAQVSAGEESNEKTTEDAKANAETGERGNADANANPSAQTVNDQEDAESQAFKKLGDTLEKWHRQNRKIHNSGKRENIEPSRPEIEAEHQEFEHLPDDDAEGEAQALDAATEDQAHTLDQRALDSEMLEAPPAFPPDSEVEDQNDTAPEVVDIDQQMAEQDSDQSARAGALLGVNTQNARGQSGGKSMQDDEDIESAEDVVAEKLDAEAEDRVFRTIIEARSLWSQYEALTRDLSLSLTEQLRLILAPTMATKMRGDFRTGKRLNIKKIIPYIASQYKRDKIWMRRSIPSKRNYQIMLAVDDSKSMGEGEGGRLAFEALAMISKSLSMLEVGQMCIVGFGESVQVAHPFEQTFSSDAGAHVFQRLGFQQARTDVKRLISASLELFQAAKIKAHGNGADLWQLELIISDGVCEDHDHIRRLVRKAQESRIMIVFVVVDSLKGESIMDMSQATFEPDEAGEARLTIKRYLDGFPFGYYLIVRDVKELPSVLAMALRQWFAEVAESV